MSIDWITAAAQILNFLVLVWLLKRFLYRPILDGIDAREAEIADRMSEATRIREKAEAAEATYQDQISAAQSREAAVLDGIREKAEAERSALLARTRERLELERRSQEAQRAEEARKYTAELQRAGAGALLSLTRKALGDLADETLEERIVAHVAKRLATIAEDLREAAGKSTAAVAITRDPLPQDARDRLKAELQKLLPEATLGFETDTQQAPGLILRLGGAQVAWTVDTYIDGLEEVLEHEMPSGRKDGGRKLKVRTNER